jgi:hypothetical protein
VVRHRGLAVTTIVYGEDGGLLRHGVLLRGGEPKVPLRLNLADLVTLRSGFALREDDLWKRSMQLDLAECHGCTVASLPQDPIAEFLNVLRRPH